MNMSDGLEIDGVESFYGDFQALHGMSLTLPKGQVLALIGANGAGKSTLLKSIVGLVSPRSGLVRWQGRAITGFRANVTLGLGIALVPEGRRLFPSLSVEENLTLGGQIARKSNGNWLLFIGYSRFFRKSGISQQHGCLVDNSKW